ncbi:fibro-slime domain-containing protein [Eubacterium sp. AM05-23]|uniref:fibro-slime domain-containing protein n=1 Tax=Eubacterium TaxID=1730 RepID=UPI000E4BDEB1|nr:MULTISPECIES: fibro-slime domain-containing protein [Eubacterium]RHO56273.1 fibro-slime domain-containing protein [Eubacterium sp. AM05-23]
MKSVKRLSRYTSILLSVLLMLSAMSPGITALAQEKANAAPTVLNYEDDSITAELKAAEGGALPTGAALQVKALNKDSQDEAEKALYAETEAGLNAKAAGQGTAVNGFIAYSVQLQDKDGKNVTPEKGSFTLKITYKNPDAPEAYQKSQSAEKGVTLYQKTEGKDEQNNTIYTMEPTQEDSTQITADENGKVQSVESELTTLEPVAVTWESKSETQVSDKAQSNTAGNQSAGTETPAVETPQTLTSPASAPVQDNGAAGLKPNQVSFSFTVKAHNEWNEKDQYFNNWIVNVVDTDGNPVTLDSHHAYVTINSGVEVSAANLARKIELPEVDGYGYQLLKAKVSGYVNFKTNGQDPKKDEDYKAYNNNESVFTKLILWKGNEQPGKNYEPYQYQYKNNNNTFGRDRINKNDDTYTNNATVTFVVKKVEAPKTVDTVDSTAKGVDIQMFNYSSSTPNFNNWGNGEGVGVLSQGLVSRNLTANNNGEKIPTALKDPDIQGSSAPDFNINFSTINNNNYQGQANHLFSKDVYDKTGGTFFYSSFENYAYWNRSSGNFSVYNALGTPSNGDNFFYQRGNFLPYNTFVGRGLSTNTNTKDENGKDLSTEDPRYNEPLYLIDDADYYFGMTVSANFAQLEGGKYNGEDMIYEFNGDDDMWVFVDDVLVLDLGGVHDAQSGSINFATGEVKWTNINNSTKQDKGKTTTIKAQFDAADKEAKGGNKTASTQWRGNTFADYTNHEIKIYYMERGAGASNCKMKFNLPVVPKGSVTVRKEIENIDEGSYSDVNFNFKLYVEDPDADESSTDTIKDSNGVKYSVRKNQPYMLKDDNVTEEKQGSTDKDTGVFTLRHGQQVRFDELSEMNTKYIIEEMNADEQLYDKFTVNSGAYDVEKVKIASTTEEGKFVLRTEPLAIGKNLWVNVENQCAATNFKNIEITKQMAENQKSDEGYKLRVTVGGQLYRAKYTLSGESEEKQCEDGIIVLKAGQTATIKNIPSGTTFNVEEIELDGNKYDNPKFTVTGADTTSIGDYFVAGIVKIDNNAKITVENKKKLGSLKITKTIDSVNYEDGDPVFTFKISGPGNSEDPDFQVFYRTLRLSKDVGKTASITIDNLPIGEYTVEELNTMRYTCISSNLQTGTVQQNNTEETKDTPPVELTFTNKLTNEDYFSHTDVVENSFKIGEDGTVTVEQHKVPEGQVPDGTTPVQPSNE